MSHTGQPGETVAKALADMGAAPLQFVPRTHGNVEVRAADLRADASVLAVATSLTEEPKINCVTKLRRVQGHPLLTTNGRTRHMDL